MVDRKINAFIAPIKFKQNGGRSRGPCSIENRNVLLRIQGQNLTYVSRSLNKLIIYNKIRLKLKA